MVTVTGEAITLAALIYGTESDRPLGDKAETIAVAMEFMGFTSDEAKADLYSLLEESLSEDTTYMDALTKITVALSINKRRFLRG